MGNIGLDSSLSISVSPASVFLIFFFIIPLFNLSRSSSLTLWKCSNKSLSLQMPECKQL